MDLKLIMEKIDGRHLLAIHRKRFFRQLPLEKKDFISFSTIREEDGLIEISGKEITLLEPQKIFQLILP